METVTVPRELLERALAALDQAVHWEETRSGRPPSQTGMYEREELRAALNQPKQEKRTCETCAHGHKPNWASPCDTCRETFDDNWEPKT